MKKILIGLLCFFAPLSLTSCSFSLAETGSLPSQNPQNLPTQFPLPSTTATIKATSESVPTVTITRYKIDDQCQSLQPTKLEVPKTQSMEKTVKTIISDRSNGDFRIAGYRLKVDPKTKIATLDIRLPQDSPRTIQSLSQCEQLALFGELRETLIKNSDWAIDTVQFRLQGKEI